ncbi:hypothetical protein [Thermococcus celer]|uniref:Uncharacterized protein n=1 Tax=Thermococcus celer Vu 13 = JCM 8558 TaxID=1293037 RepID=A0A218P2Y4_THECE|nr:hypothetical protein [Thermococcus celer]ASI99282.1 hypothetical protein A3L02_06775 [Thermococcus celer Vu 13 = JCM 8558]
MKRALVLLTLVFITLLPPVSAGGLTYYPNQSAFQAFLHSNSSYTVIAGNDDWARGWAYYIDERLHTVKPRGKGTIVLVGNVRDNPEMAKVWARTGLPENASLLPSIVVLNDTVLVTGSEDNVYLTERAFEGLWNPPEVSRIAFLFVALAVFLILLLHLSRDGGHAGSFYLLSSSLLGLWYLTAEKPLPTDAFLRHFLEGLKFAAGGSPSSPLGAVLGVLFKVMPPIEENLVFFHWVLILLMASFSFYLAPKRARELGLLVFGLIFVSPTFRESLHHINGTAPGLATLTVTLAVISNVTFSPERWKALLQTLVLSALTLLLITVNPCMVLVPVIFVLTFPKRHLRNYAYLLITGVGVFLLYTRFGLPAEIPRGLAPDGWGYLGRFLFENLLALTAITYVALNGRRRIRMRGQTAFLLLMTAVYPPMALFVPALFSYCFILLAGLTVRLIYGFTPGT